MKKCLFSFAAVLLALAVLFPSCAPSVTSPEENITTQAQTDADISETDADLSETEIESSGSIETAPPIEGYDLYTSIETPPEDPNYFAPQIKLNHNSTTVYANAFRGEFDSVVYEAGGMRIADGKTEGSFISEDIDLDGAFTKLVCSWNAQTHDGTVEISLQAKKSDGSYTDPFSWGVWSSKEGVSSSVSTKNNDGKVSTDVLTLNVTCTGIVRFIVKLKKTAECSVVVKQ